ncbi:Uncharacterised protein [uncultured archaeon]|nr:Uncharacterised protein [uncultured archaeon]
MADRANPASAPASRPDWRARIDALFDPRSGSPLLSDRPRPHSGPAPSDAGAVPRRSASSPSTPEPPSFLSSLARQLMLAIAVLLAAGLVLMLLAPVLLPPPSWSVEVQEAPLFKNARLNLTPGDYLVYRIDLPEGPQLIRLDARLSPGCPGIRLTDSTTGAMAARQQSPSRAPAPSPASADSASASPPLSAYSVCLGWDGVERSSANQRLGSNLSFSSLSWPYFQPWMLALREDWRWSARTRMRVQPFNLTYAQDIALRTLNRSSFAGRDAFWVEVSYPPSAEPWSAGNASATPPVRLAIDAQRRVLLYSESEGVRVSLVDASFFENHSLS